MEGREASAVLCFQARPSRDEDSKALYAPPPSGCDHRRVEILRKSCGHCQLRSNARDTLSGRAFSAASTSACFATRASAIASSPKQQAMWRGVMPFCSKGDDSQTTRVTSICRHRRHAPRLCHSRAWRNVRGGRERTPNPRSSLRSAEECVHPAEMAQSFSLRLTSEGRHERARRTVSKTASRGHSERISAASPFAHAWKKSHSFSASGPSDNGFANEQPRVSMNGGRGLCRTRSRPSIAHAPCARADIVRVASVKKQPRPFLI